jgi:hypothetical protein
LEALEVSAKSILANHSIEQIKSELNNLSNSLKDIDAQSRGFSIEPFKSHKRELRADRGKKHRYPSERRKPCLNSSLNVNDSNLSLNAKHGKHKGSPSMREYWKFKKREERKKKAKK